MESNSQVREQPDSEAVIESQLRECYGRVVFSHKTHEKCADIYLARWSKIKLWQIGLSAVTATGFVFAILGVGTAAAVVGAVVATVLLALNAYTKDYDLGALAQKHRQAGAELWLIREEYLSLLTDLRAGGIPIPNLRDKRDELLASLHAVYAGAPSTTPKAYKAAQDALKCREDMTFSDEEIDSFLPERLRRTRGNA